MIINFEHQTTRTYTQRADSMKSVTIYKGTWVKVFWIKEDNRKTKFKTNKKVHKQ